MGNVTLDFEVVKQIGDVSAEAVIVFSLSEEKILYANTHACTLLKLETGSNRLDIESIISRVVPQDREYLRNQYSTVGDKLVSAEIEFRLLDEKQKQIFVCCNFFLVGNGSAIVAFIKDITRPKEHESYLVEYGARKNTALDTLSHQISGALNLMQHLAAEAGKYVESTNNKNLQIYLDLLNDNSSHSLQIIHGLLKDEHKDSPSISVKNSRIDIIERISFIHLQLTRSHRNRKFYFQTFADSFFIYTDDIKVLQIVNNFTSNAIKFSAADKPISIDVSEAGDYIIISVADNGIGIPEDLKPFVFQPQFGEGRKGLNGEPSIGLGLSICKGLIQLLKGTVWFDSAEGEGSTFYASLPKETLFPKRIH